jgi:hypothetical protein
MEEEKLAEALAEDDAEDITKDSHMDNFTDTWNDYLRTWKQAQTVEGKAKQSKIEEEAVGTKVVIDSRYYGKKNRVVRKDDNGLYVTIKGERIAIELIGKAVLYRD